MIEEFWTLTEAALRSHGSEAALKSILPGVIDERDFDKITRLAGAPLPETFKKFFRTRGGQKYPMSTHALLHGHVVLSLNGMFRAHDTDLTHYLVLADDPDEPPAICSPGVRNVLYDPRWIPVAWDAVDGESFYAIDFHPAPGGVAGQIIRVLAPDPGTGDEQERVLVAPTFDEWIAIHTVRLRAGSIPFDPELGFRSNR